MESGAREKKIKSADRVLEILEMFDGTRDHVTVMDVARNLQYPQSSTSELLVTLVKHGYLTRERSTRTYRPTARVALLGAWVQPKLFRDGRLLPMMDELAEDTGEAVVLASIVDVKLRHLHCVGCVPCDLRSGSDHHILHSPLGRTLIFRNWAEHTRGLVHRLNAESDAARRVRANDLLADLEVIRRRGYDAGPVSDSWSSICVQLPQTDPQERLALGLLGPTARLDARRDDLVQLIRRSVAEHFAPAASPPANGYPALAAVG